jgi:hypothetical protein
VAEYRKKHHTTPQADAKLIEPYRGLTRFQISKIVDRERMRFEAETIRKHRDRAKDAKAQWLAAKAALAARDRFYGRP